MKTFEIEIKETLQRVIEVEAESEEEACKIVSDKYNNEEIILDDSDFVDKEISSYLYSEKYLYLFKNYDFKKFILKESKIILNSLSIEELTKLAFGDIINAKEKFEKH